MNLLYGIGIIASLIAYDNNKNRNKKKYKIKIISFKFKPKELTIKKGDTVVFNAEDSSHNILFKKKENKKYDHREELKKGEEHEVTFEESGTYDYYCGPHRWMIGKIIVK